MRMLVVLACLIVTSLIATSAFADPVPRAYINNEDSHPHEVFPNRTTEFYIDVLTPISQMNSLINAMR